MSRLSRPFERLSPEEAAARGDALLAPGTDGRLWCVLHARPRCEKKAAAACDELLVRNYLPLRQSTPRHRKGQRRYSFDIPLFPGYLFGCCNREERYSLLCSDLLVRMIDVVDQEQLLRELRSVYLAICSQVDLALYPQLRRGRLVRVTSGPLRGVVGRIARRKEGLRIVLNVSMLGTAVAAELDMADVELVA